MHYELKTSTRKCARNVGVQQTSLFARTSNISFHMFSVLYCRMLRIYFASVIRYSFAILVEYKGNHLKKLKLF